MGASRLSSPIGVPISRNNTQRCKKVNGATAVSIDRPDNASVGNETEALTTRTGFCDRASFRKRPFLKRREPPAPGLVPD
jgi:hypothetical protein